MERSFQICELSPLGTVGTWAFANTSGVISYKKSAADDTSVVYIPVPIDVGDPVRRSGIKEIRVRWKNATDALDAAASFAVAKISVDATTKAVSRTALTVTTTNTPTGVALTAVDDHETRLILANTILETDGDTFQVEMTINAAATSVVEIFGISVHSSNNLAP